MSRLEKFIGGLSLLASIVVPTTMVFAPQEAFAVAPGAPPGASLAAYYICRAAGGGILACTAVQIAADPTGVGVTGLDISLSYDPSVYTFDPGASGPLGIFSSGGGALAAAPGVGTEPLQVAPATGLEPGAPLGTVTLTQGPGSIAVEYDLSSPITLSSDENFFVFTFDLNTPIRIDPSTSTTTYLASGPGADFTQTSFSCSTMGGTGCGSTTPSSGITSNLTIVPELPVWAMLLLGFVAIGFAGQRRAILRALRERTSTDGRCGAEGLIHCPSDGSGLAIPNMCLAESRSARGRPHFICNLT
jgi:hypothetical protein